MKKGIWLCGLLTLALMVILTGCSGGDGFKKAASSKMGSGGGELKVGGDEFLMTLPAGALVSDSDVTVSVNKAADIMGPGQASPVYEIAGIGDFTKPVTLKLKTTVPLKGETMVMASIRKVAMNDKTSVPEFHFYPCTVGNGFVEVTIDPSGKTTVVQRFLNRLFALGGTSYAVTTDDTMMAAAVMTDLKKADPVKEFHIVASSDVTPEQVKAVEGYCTDAVSIVKGLGFDTSKYKDYPLEIQVRGLNWFERDSSKKKDEQDAGFGHHGQPLQRTRAARREHEGRLRKVLQRR